MPVKIFENIPTNICNEYLQWESTDDDDIGLNLLDVPVSEFYTSNELIFPSISDINYDNCNSVYNNNTLNNINTTQLQLKQQIRNHDCMWSGRCVAHPEKAKGHSKNSLSTYNNNNNNNQIQNNNNNKIITSQQIPAGRSLLLTSRCNQINNRIQMNNKLVTTAIPEITTSAFLKERDTQVHPAVMVRPDTPISLDEDHLEFKHNVDLAACTMGSNQISLSHTDESSARIIDLLKAHLEDTSPDSHIIKNGLRLPIKEETLDNVLEYLQELADFPPISSFHDGNKSHCSNNINPNDDEDDSDSDESNFSGNGSICNSNNLKDNNSLEHQMRTIKLEYQSTHDGDHCYTRCKTRVDPAPLGVQTPSDSEEEEIDVVSVGDKTLPTNPSARDRRALQTTVADKITARMVKTPKDSKNMTQRKTFSDEDSFTSSSGSSSPVKLNSSHSFTSVQCNDITSSRKRSHPSKESGNGGNKRNRGKKQKSPGKRQSSDSDEADTIEKRNLHNDMERQRRIGLKNLFEELKCQIPNIKDKERAPKVSILREAASLCNKLNREQEQINYLKKQQARLLQRVKSLRMSLAPKWG